MILLIVKVFNQAKQTQGQFLVIVIKAKNSIADKVLWVLDDYEFWSY